MINAHNADDSETSRLISSPINVEEDLVNSEDDSCVSKVKQDSISLLWVLNRCFGRRYYTLCILKFFADMLAFTGPILMSPLISYLEMEKEQEGNVRITSLLCASLVLGTLISALLSSRVGYAVNKVSIGVKTTLVDAIYKKALLINGKQTQQDVSMNTMNLMSTDCERVTNFCNSFHLIWSLPFQIGLSLYLLYVHLGLAFLAGFFFALLLIPINKCIASKNNCP